MVSTTIASGSGVAAKAQLRQRLLSLRREVSLAQREAWQAAIAERLSTVLESLPSARTIAVYWPIAGEPDLRLLWARLHADGLALALPVVGERDSPLQFRHWRPGMELATDAAGVPAPLESPALDVDMIVVPCVGLDARGFRLGYGGGYFDRTLQHLGREVVTVGIAFDFQRCEFPVEAFDVALSIGVTPSATVDYRPMRTGG
jgi:5,10-methenyltetrahydrofolate synthetase